MYAVQEEKSDLYVRVLRDGKCVLTKQCWATKCTHPSLANLLKERCELDGYINKFKVVEVP